MAAIDKTYITQEEYSDYRSWWIANYDKMIKELGYPITLYPFQMFEDVTKITPKYLKKNKEDFDYFFFEDKNICVPVLNTSEEEDKWLIKNCKIQSYQDRLREVYDEDWEGFNIKNVVE